MVKFLRERVFCLTFGILSIPLVVSCDRENLNQKEESLIASKSNEQFKVYYTSGKDKEVVIGQLLGEFYWYIHTDLGFDSDNGDEIAFDVVDNKEEKSLSIMIDDQILNRSMSVDEMMWANAFDNSLNNTNNKTLGTGKQKLYLQCSGGKNDSKTLTVDRPSDVNTATESGKKMAPFINDCLKGGGCVLVCKSTVKVSKG